ncbi:MAG: prolipoprotein diacylglyceryl transferase [Firmicutes bacterium]|nr:prolipoprotein diacylglyceryl transferase [Bacillota bacterium]
MLPELHILGRSVPTYGLLAMTGVLAALLYLKLEERRLQESNADIDLAFLYSLIGAFIGAKLLSIITSLPDIRAAWPFLVKTPAAFLQNYLLSGFVFYGGLYGALLVCLLYAKHERLDFAALLCRLLPTLALIHGFGRVGCFLTGCCYGIPHPTLGVILPNSAIAPHDVPLLPVQLYEAALEFLLFAVLARMGRKQKDGYAMLGVYLLTYGIARFFLEFCRGDAYRGFIGPLSLSQAISLPTALLGLFLLLYAARRRQPSEGAVKPPLC